MTTVSDKVRIICQVYAMEISPNRIRGCMITFSNVWSGVGGIVTSLMMQQLNTKHPDNYLIAMRVIWGPIGIMGLCWAWIPESPWYHARRGNEAAALKALKRLYSGVTGMDLQEEYGIIVRTIEHERAMLPSRPRYIDVFKGLNLVGCSMLPALADHFSPETYNDCHDPCCGPTRFWLGDHWHILDL